MLKMCLDFWMLSGKQGTQVISGLMCKIFLWTWRTTRVHVSKLEKNTAENVFDSLCSHYVLYTESETVTWDRTGTKCNLWQFQFSGVQRTAITTVTAFLNDWKVNSRTELYVHGFNICFIAVLCWWFLT